MTKKPKPPTPAEQLRALMRQHELTNAQVAELLVVSVKTVESWLASPKAASHRRMGAPMLDYFKMKLREGKKP